MESEAPSMKSVNDMTVKELKDELGRRSAKKSGTKKTLIER